MSVPVIQVEHLSTRFGTNVVHDNLNLTINKSEINAIVGGSGSGKTTLLRNMLMLLPPTSGTIHILGTDIGHCNETQALNIKHQCGVSFQQGALFTSLTVLENVLFPLREFTHLSERMRYELALFKLEASGFPLKSIHAMPSDLSGGMRKRVAVARAIILDPQLLFLDEPTAGLDPSSSAEMGELILHLSEYMHLTIIVVTHDMDLVWQCSDRVIFLGDKHVLAHEPMQKLIDNPHSIIQAYFSFLKSAKRKK